MTFDDVLFAYAEGLDQMRCSCGRSTRSPQAQRAAFARNELRRPPG